MGNCWVKRSATQPTMFYSISLEIVADIEEKIKGQSAVDLGFRNCFALTQLNLPEVSINSRIC